MNKQSKDHLMLESQKFNNDFYKLHTDNINTILTAHLKAVNSYALSAIRGAFLLNGAAAIAALSSDNLIDNKEIILYIVKYGAIGAMLAVLCAGISYVAQRIYMASDLYICRESFNIALGTKFRNRIWIERQNYADNLSILASVVFIASIGCFIYGLMQLPTIFQFLK